MALCAGRNLSGGVALQGERTTTHQHRLRGDNRRGRCMRRMLGGEVARDLAQIGVGQSVDHPGHGSCTAPALAKMLQLVEEIPGRLACDARPVAIGRRAALRAMTADASGQARLECVGRGRLDPGGSAARAGLGRCRVPDRRHTRQGSDQAEEGRCRQHGAREERTSRADHALTSERGDHGDWSRRAGEEIDQRPRRQAAPIRAQALTTWCRTPALETHEYTQPSPIIGGGRRPHPCMPGPAETAAMVATIGYRCPFGYSSPAGLFP